MDVDTGSDATTVTVDDYSRSFQHLDIHELSCPMVGFDGHPVEGVLGTINSQISYGGRTCDGIIHVVPNTCSSVLGKNVIGPLGLTLTTHVHQLSPVSPDPLTPDRSPTKYGSFTDALAEFPDICSSSPGLYPDFEHVITVSPDAKPVVARLRPIPLARRDAVNDEIQKMLDEGIWERVDRAPWVHGLVVVPRPSPRPSRMIQCASRPTCVR